MAKTEGTVRVKMLVSQATFGKGSARNSGDEVDIPAREAEKMVAAGICELVKSGGKETATKKPVGKEES